jgi:predicted hotdog family 3-hydroxylacyl-ACP dehydratase
MSHSEDESVLARVEPATWSPEDGTAYEVALEGINQVIGAYSALIGRAEASDALDSAAIESWRTAQGEWAQKRRALSPADRAGVAQVRAACSALLAELRGSR